MYEPGMFGENEKTEPETRKTVGNDEMFGRYINAGDFVPGLTKREYFAAMAMQGLLATYHQAGLVESNRELGVPPIEEIAVKAADVLIEALNKDQK